MKEAKKMQVTDQICKQVQLMRKGGANQTEIGKLLGINPCTVSRMEAAGFDMQRYTEMRKERREKEKARANVSQESWATGVELVYDPSIAEDYRREQEAKRAEEQVPGQMKMNLTTGEKKEEEAAAFDQVKMMRFLAGRFDVIEKSQALGVEMLRMEIDKLNDTMSMVLRAIRKE